jgi:hypothetical protein
LASAQGKIHDSSAIHENAAYKAELEGASKLAKPRAASSCAMAK